MNQIKKVNLKMKINKFVKMQTIAFFSVCIFQLILVIPLPISAQQKSIYWAGYEWYLRDAINKGPGPNNWTSNNVWIDEQNHLHLKLAHSPVTGWTSAGLFTKHTFGFGTFRWFVEAAIDRFDPNVVLGLFTYGGKDNINEIDIEIAKFGRVNPEASNLFYSVYPRELGIAEEVSYGKRISLEGTYTTHQFLWTADYVSFQSQHGFKTSPNKSLFFSFQTPENFSSVIPFLEMPLCLNLWTFQGRPPTDGQEVEVLLHDFQYIEA